MQKNTNTDIGIYYQKIRFSTEDFDFEKFKGGVVTEYNDIDVSLTYFKPNKLEVLQKLLNSAPFKIKPNFFLLAEIKGNGFLRPHIDHNIVTSLNFYIESNNDVTTFYSLKEGLESKPNCHYFDLKSLNFVEYFIAGKKDCYLLDVANIHSVKTNGISRKFITWQWADTDYKNVLESFDDPYL